MGSGWPGTVHTKKGDIGRMSHDQIVALIHTHLARYSEAGVADVYKLLHQATFGPGHLIASQKAAREILEQECEQLAPARDQALVENIHPQGAIVRVHLRPYLAYRSRVDWLLDAMVRSAEDVQGDPAIMAARWQVFATLCQTSDRFVERFNLREVDLFGQFRSRENWPAVQHSPAYVRAYQPKYRVLTRGEADALCTRLQVPFEMI